MNVTDEYVQRAKDAYEEARSKGTFHEAIRAALESLPAVRVPDGWKLVPSQPSRVMLNAMDHAMTSKASWLETYWAMLSASPNPNDAKENG